MWNFCGAVKMPHAALYSDVVTVGRKFYLIGLEKQLEQLEHFKMVELNFDTLTCSDVVPFTTQLISGMVSIAQNYHAFGEHIIFTIYKHDSLEDHLLNLNTVTRQWNQHQLNTNHMLTTFTNCVVDNKLYVFSFDTNRNVFISIVDLITIIRKWIVVKKASLVCQRRFAKMVAHGNNIYWFDLREAALFIFNTLYEEWIKVKNYVDDFVHREDITQGVYANGELYVFKLSCDVNEPYISRCAEIFNFQTLRWRKAQFSHLPQFSDRCTMFLFFEGKIVSFLNSKKSIKMSQDMTEGLVSEDGADDDDDLEIFLLDLNLT
ncbi:hypothetical protein CHUAL_005721 [Chamberlinius hualienensis]